MIDRLYNPYKNGILLKLKSKYKGIWKDIYKIFEIYQALIQLDQYMVLTLQETEEKELLGHKFKIFFKEFKRHYQVKAEIDSLFLNKFLEIIDNAMEDSNIDKKSLILKVGSNPKFKIGLRSIESLIKVILTFNNIIFTQRERISEGNYKYYEFKASTHNIDIDTNEVIKQQIKINSKLKEYQDLEIERDITEKGLTKQTQVINEQVYEILLNAKGEIDSVYTEDNRKHRTIELAIKHNLIRKNIDQNYNKISIQTDSETGISKLLLNGKVIKTLEKVNNVEDRILDYDQGVLEENKGLKKYEAKKENAIISLSLSENDITRQVSVAQIKDDKGMIRPVIVSGKFKGVFLDQIVSTMGHMLDTEFFTINTENNIIRKIRNDGRLLGEPYITLIEDKLVLSLPLNAVKEDAIVEKIAQRISKREFIVKPEQFISLRLKLGSVILSKSAKDYIYKYLQIEDKNTYIKSADSLKEHSIDKIEGFKKDITEFSLHEKQVLDWIEKNPRGIIGINRPIEKLVIGLALKNPNEKYILVTKNKGNIAKEINKSSNLVPTNLKEISPKDLKNAIPSKYAKIFFNDVKEAISHPSKYYFTSTSVANRIEKLYDLQKFVNNEGYSNNDLFNWCSKYSNRVVDSFVGFKKETKDEFLDWMRTHTFICSGKDLHLEEAIGLPTEKQTDILISNMDYQVSSVYENISKKITTLLSTPTLDKKQLSENLELLNNLLNNPQKAITKLGYSFKVENPKLDIAKEIASKNKAIFFTEDEDLAKQNAISLSNKIPKYHAYIEGNTIYLCEYGIVANSTSLDKFKNTPLASITAQHKQLKDIDIDDYDVAVHLDRGNYSLDTLEERSNLVGGSNIKEIYIDATTRNPTLDKIFQEMTLEQKAEIENLFKPPAHYAINSNLEGLSINKDLLEGVVSASPTVYNIVQNRILKGNKESLIYKAFVDKQRFYKLERNNPHVVAKVRSAALKVNVPYEQLLDIACLTSIHNPITISQPDDCIVTIKENGDTKEVEIFQKHFMLGDWSKETDNAINRKIIVKNNKIVSVENKLLTTTLCSPKGLGTKAIFSQYKMALKYKVGKITTFAAGDNSAFSPEGKLLKENFIGYYVWPKLGYNGNIFESLDAHQSKTLLESLNNPKWDDLRNWLYKYTDFSPNRKNLYISDVYACSVNNILIGQQWWKENGVALDLSLDTNPKSVSYRIINSYFKKKCDEEGYTEEEFLTRDLPPFNVNSLECWNRVIVLENFLGVNNNNINETIQLYSSQLIKTLIREAGEFPFTKALKHFLFAIYKTKHTIRKKVIFKAIPESIFKDIFKKIYLQESQKRSQDAILEEFFNDIVNGTIKISSEKDTGNDISLLEIAEDKSLDEEWIKEGLSIKAKAIKKEITESDPLIKKKVK